MAGFYGGPVFDPRGLFGPAPYPGLLTVIETGLSRWLWFIAPWVVVAIGAGVLYGLLGRWWGQSRSIVAGVAIALPFIVEPVAWRVYDGFARGPLVVWFVEIAVGIALLGWVLVARRPLSAPHAGEGCHPSTVPHSWLPHRTPGVGIGLLIVPMTHWAAGERNTIAASSVSAEAATARQMAGRGALDCAD